MRALPVVMFAILTLSACASAQVVADSNESRPTETTETTPTEPTPTDPSPTEPTPTETSPTETTPPEPELAPRPAAANCYVVGKGAFQRQQDGSFPLPCSKPHTAETYAVYVVDPSPRPNEIDRIWRKCHDRFRSYVGASATVSTLGIALIMPSTQQATAGQGWIRCDVIERNNFNGKGGRGRTGSAQNLLATGVPAAFRGCAKHWPRVQQAVHFTPCNRKHQAELIPVSTRIGGPDDPFPGEAVTQDRSATFCENHVSDYVPEALNYYYYYPTKSSWPAGSRDTVCWALDQDGEGLPPI